MPAERLPPGPPPRDPTAPARLLDAAGEVGLRVERAQRHVDQLDAALQRLLRALQPGAGGGRR